MRDGRQGQGAGERSAVRAGLARIAAWAAPLAFGWALLAPRVASACAVCFAGGSDESRKAFIHATALMTFLPLVMIGGMVWWLRRRHLQLQLELQASEEPQPVRRIALG